MSSLRICPQCGSEYELDQRFCPKDGSTLRFRNETGDLVGAIVADRYHVLRKLGEGGMGQVYLAEHVKMGRRSALKVMNPAMVKDADAVSRFNREAANASRINHPNVADIYDFGETPEGVTYLAMEFVDGMPLTKLIEQEGALPPARAANIARQAADGLGLAHEMGIVHRDLKPDNLMIARGRDGSDCVKIVDFGIAKAAGNAAQQVTRTGLVIGTPEYMSPEQLAGDKLDGRSDIYALGLVTFNMLTGQLPFPAQTAQESMMMRLTDRPRRLAEMRPDERWGDALQTVLDRALARDVARRYQTAGEFGRDLERAVEELQVPGEHDGDGTVPAQAAASATTIPPTRVRGAGVGQRLVSPSAVGHRGRTPIYATAAIVGIAAAGGGYMLLHREGAQRTDSGVTLGAAAQSHQGSATPQRPVGTADAAAPGGGSAGPSSTASTVASSSSSSTSVPPVAVILDSIESLTNPLEHADSATAARALRRLDQLSGSGSADDRLRATIIRAEAEMLLGRQQRACSLLNAIRNEARDTNRKRVTTLLSTCF